MMSHSQSIEALRNEAKAKKGGLVVVTHIFGGSYENPGQSRSIGYLQQVWKNFILIEHPKTGIYRKIYFSKVIKIEVIRP